MYVISENIHNVEGKRFSCERCNKTFSTSKAVQDHVRQKHQKFHMCTLCERIFTAKAKLMSHLTNDHYFDGTEDNLFLCPLCQAKLPTSIGNVQFYFILWQFCTLDGVANLNLIWLLCDKCWDQLGQQSQVYKT